MILIYRPADAPEERHDLDDLSAVEAEAIERVTDLDWDEAEAELKAQKPGVLRAALWTFRKRADPELRYNSFDVPGWRKRLVCRLTAEETAEHVQELVDQESEPTPDRARVLHALRKVALEPADVDTALTQAEAGAGAGKAGAGGSAASAPSGSATGGLSRTTSTSPRRSSTG